MVSYNKSIILFSGVLMMLSAVRESAADSVFLKNGREVTGTIVEETDDKIKIDCMDMGMFASYSKKNVAKIVRESDRGQEPCIEEAGSPSYSAGSIFSKCTKDSETITTQTGLQKSWFALPITTGEGMFNPVFLPFGYVCEGGEEDKNQVLTFPCLLSFKFDLVPDTFCTRHPAFVFRSDPWIGALFSGEAFELEDIGNYVKRWQATHAIGGEVVQTGDGYKGVLAVFDEKGQNVLSKKYDKAMPYFSLMGSMVKDFMAFRNQPVKGNLEKELFRPMTRDSEAIKLYGGTFYVRWRSREEWDIYEKILKIDPDFAEVRYWYANQRGWEIDDHRKTQEEYGKVLRSNLVMTLMTQFCVGCNAHRNRLDEFENVLRQADAMYEGNPTLIAARLEAEKGKFLIEDIDQYLPAAQKYTCFAPLIDDVAWICESYFRYDMAMPLYISELNSTFLSGDANFDFAYAHLGRMFYHLGYYPEALFCINKGLEDCRADIEKDLLSYKGLVLQELFDFTEARQFLFSDLTQENLKKENFIGMISLLSAEGVNGREDLSDYPGGAEFEKRFSVEISAYYALISGDPAKALSLLARYPFRYENYDVAKTLLAEMIRAEAYLKMGQVNQAREHAFKAWYLAPRSRLTAYLFEQVAGNGSGEFGNFVETASFIFPGQAYWKSRQHKFSEDKNVEPGQIVRMFTDMKKAFDAVPESGKENFCFRQVPFSVEYLCLNILRNKEINDKEKELALAFFMEYSRAVWRISFLQKAHTRNFFVLLLQMIPEKDRRGLLEKFEAATVDRSVVVNRLVADAYGYAGTEEYDEALSTLEKARNLDANNARVLNCFANVLLYAHRFDEVISFADKARGIDPLYTEPYINKGFAMIELGDRMGALDEFKKAFETDPDYERQIDDVFSDRFGWRGCEYRNQGKINAAIDDFLTAVKIKPDSAVSYYNLACCYAVNNNKEEALYYLGKAINLDPKRRQKAQSDEDFNSIREDADFKKIVSGGMEDDAYVPAEDDAPEED